MNQESGSVFGVVLVPAIIALVVTLLRLLGELQDWSSVLFGAEAGGGAALVGITWLVPIFGVYFGVRLIRQGEGLEKPGQAIWKGLLLFVGFIAVIVVSTLAFGTGSMLPLMIGFPAALVICWLACKVWPALGKILFAYGLLSRTPVAIVMLFAFIGDWGTHYDALPPGFSADMGLVGKFIVLGLLPQYGGWLAFTMVVGLIFAGIAGFFVRQPSRSAEASI